MYTWWYLEKKVLLFEDQSVIPGESTKQSSGFFLKICISYLLEETCQRKYFVKRYSRMVRLDMNFELDSAFCLVNGDKLSKHESTYLVLMIDT